MRPAVGLFLFIEIEQQKSKCMGMSVEFRCLVP